MRLLRTLTTAPLAIGVMLSLLVCGGILGLRSTGNLVSPELIAYDWLFCLRPPVLVPVSRVALITIADSDINALGAWPLSDQTLAQALELLTQYGARAIGVDLYRPAAMPPGHEALVALFTNNPRIIAITKFGGVGEESVPPPPELQQTEQVGFSDFIVDAGGVVRRGLLFLDDGTQVMQSLALRLALLYLQAEGVTPQPDAANPAHLHLGRATIRPFEANDGGYVNADARGYQFLLDFQETPRTFPAFSLTALLAGQVPAQAIRNRIVVLGVTVTETVKDYFFVPYSRRMPVDQRVAGIMLHAHSASQLLRAALQGHATITTLSDTLEVVWLLLWGVLGGVVGVRTRSPWRLVGLVAGGLLLLGLLAYGAFFWQWWLPVVPQGLAWVTSAAVVTAYMAYQETAQRSLLMRLFAQHVSAEVAELIWQQREQFLDGGRPRPQRLIVTVLFSDFQGFTSVSEHLQPQVLLEWLNICIGSMAQVIVAHHGVVDDYAGDGIKANFGVPFARITREEISQDAVHAVDCALAMRRELHQLNARLQAQQLPPVRMRIGIYTGPVVAGSVGSVQRLKYTTVGDTVNTASRLESYDKTMVDPNEPCRILVGETTVRYLGQHFQTEWVSHAQLKGKEESVAIYQVLGRATTESTARREEEQT